MFVGGAETTTNALSAGVALLVREPQVWLRLKSDPERVLATFAEEVLRLESPVQTLMRVAKVDVELRGVRIPAGSVVGVRYGAANRDERAFERPEELDLERDRPSRHLAFRELVRRVDRMWFIEDANDFEHHSNYYLRALKRLEIGVASI